MERVYGNFGIDSAIVRYHEPKQSGPAEAFDESLLNSLGYRLLRSDRVEDAIAVFELNVAEYPDASNPYDSLGEAYLAADDPDHLVLQVGSGSSPNQALRYSLVSTNSR